MKIGFGPHPAATAAEKGKGGSKNYIKRPTFLLVLIFVIGFSVGTIVCNWMLRPLNALDAFKAGAGHYEVISGDRAKAVWVWTGIRYPE